MIDLLKRLRSPQALAGVFSFIGVLHFIVPKAFESAIPDFLPAKRALVYGSGVAELVCAAGLFTEQEWAAPASAATLLAVWPANISMAVDATRDRKPRLAQLALWGRVPMQLPMIHTALTAPAAWAAARSRTEGAAATAS
jgi:uncharacterized membrane protein